jgi:hypothetical protein
MKVKMILIAAVFSLACLAGASSKSTAASATPSCSNWLKQNDGSYWRECVDDSGRTYCEVSKNGTVSRVSCR